MWGFLNNIWNVPKATDSTYFYSFTFINFFYWWPRIYDKVIYSDHSDPLDKCVQGIHNANFECVVWLSKYSFHIHPVIFACSSWSCSMCLARCWIAGKLLFSFYHFLQDWKFQSSLNFVSAWTLNLAHQVRAELESARRVEDAQAAACF